MGRLRNFVVLPIAIAERNGSAELHLNAYEASSSLLRADEAGVKSWDRQYEGAPGKSEIVDFMESKGFRLRREESQSHGQEANLTFLRS